MFQKYKSGPLLVFTMVEIGNVTIKQGSYITYWTWDVHLTTSSWKQFSEFCAICGFMIDWFVYLSVLHIHCAAHIWAYETLDIDITTIPIWDIIVLKYSDSKGEHFKTGVCASRRRGEGGTGRFMTLNMAGNNLTGIAGCPVADRIWFTL